MLATAVERASIAPISFASPIALGLLGEPLGLGDGDGEGLGDLAGGAGDQQLAQVGDQVAGELAGVAARAGEAVDDLERRRGVAGGERVGGVEEQVGVGGAEQLDHVVGRDLVAAEGDELVERPERVAEAAGRRARDQGDGAVLDLDALGCRRRA